MGPVRINSSMKNISNFKKNALIYQIENPLDWFAVFVAVYVLIWREYLTYTQIGTIIGIGLAVELLLEIPSGAIADLLGRKVTIILGRVIKFFGYLILAIANNFWLFLIGYAFYQINEALYSGAGEALIYDSLKENKKEDLFKKIIPRTFTFCTFGLAIASLFGGFLFEINSSFPYLAAAFTSLLSLILTLFYDEPKLDSIKINLKNYIAQNINGFKHIFSTITLKYISIFSIAVLALSYSGTWYFHQQLVSSFGYTSLQMGTLFFILYILRAISSMFLKKILAKDHKNYFTIFLAISLSLCYMFSLGAGIIRGSFVLGWKFITDGITWPVTSILQNKYIESKYRATALSSISLLTSAVLAAGGTFIGIFIEKMGVRMTVFFFGLIFAFISIPISFKFRRHLNEINE